MQIGIRRYRVMRTRSTQKLPIVLALSRARARTSAAAIAMPTAADQKLWLASATICEKYDIVFSPAELCQLVLVVKLTEVLKARCGGSGGLFVSASTYWGHGSQLWRRRTA